MSAYEQAYAPTQPGTIEVKTVPGAVALQAEASGTYFASSNQLFNSLFRYISRNDVKMTVPVEADIVEASRMRFFVGSEARGRALGSGDGVVVVERPERRVVAIGLRGAYGERTFQEGRAGLTAWLSGHPEWISAGAPYAVYWNGPFVPWFAKRSEVHVEIVPAPTAAGEATAGSST